MLNFRDGDQNAFRILFKEYGRKIINFCYRFCGDLELAEELAQEAFLRVYKAAPRYRADARFSTWIFRIATNVCLNEMRKARYNSKTESLDILANTDGVRKLAEIEDRSHHPQALLESQETDHLVHQAIMNLPEKQRAALLLRIHHGFSYQEIGEQIRVSENGVKTLIHRGRQRLRQALRVYFEDNK